MKIRYDYSVKNYITWLIAGSSLLTVLATSLIITVLTYDAYQTQSALTIAAVEDLLNYGQSMRSTHKSALLSN